MAEEPPAVQDFSDDLVEELAGEVVGGTTRDQMLGTFSGVSSRLVTVHNGAVLMHAETEDPEIVIWSVVRVVSEKEVVVPARVICIYTRAVARIVLLFPGLMPSGFTAKGINSTVRPSPRAQAH